MRASDFRAFIFAAGEGRRLKPYTESVPKPMVHIAGKPILDHTFRHLETVGISKVAMNSFYKKEAIRAFVRDYQGLIDISLSEEDELLNTGLGLKRALPTMGGKPFYAINGDAFWTDKAGEGENALERLAEAWSPEIMDILLLLQPVSNMILTKGVGDYALDKQGRAIRQKDQAGDYMFAGIRICKPEIFENTPESPFGFLDLMDRAEAQGRLFGVVHTGDWHHISTPDDLERVNEAFSANLPKEVCA